MKPTLAAVAAVFTLASGCALNGAANSPGTSAVGASTGGAGQARSGARTREEVYAEALEAAKHHKSTMEEEIDYFLPWRQ